MLIRNVQKHVERIEPGELDFLVRSVIYEMEINGLSPTLARNKIIGHGKHKYSKHIAISMDVRYLKTLNDYMRRIGKNVTYFHYRGYLKCSKNGKHKNDNT